MTNAPPGLGATDRERAERSFAAVFESTDPFGDLFRPAVERRAILFPIEPSLEEGQLAALANAASRLEEKDALFRWAEVPSDLMGPIWRVSLNDFGVYSTVADHRGFDSALWSSTATWGMFISHEGHGLVGGPPDFIENLLGGFPQTERTRTTLVVRPEMPRVNFQDAEPGAAIDHMIDHYRKQGAEVDPPVRVGARDQGFAFAVECARTKSEEGAEITWLPALLRHIYGIDEAGKILERSGLEALRVDVDDDG
jgi:hypothetical protein